MKRRMVLSVVCMMLAAATVALSGCPALGIGKEPTLGKIVVHNQAEADISFLSLVLVPDECSNQHPDGVNLLPEPIAVGGSFAVDDLAPGRYYGHVTGRGELEDVGYISVAAGATVDWYAR